jgi:catechol 2,3-dioxygenase-like lactoylglutathione lyase family enzyme
METRFDHVGLSVGSLAGAQTFLAAAFGFEEEFRFELPGEIHGLMLRHPSGMRLELFEHPRSGGGIRVDHPLEAPATRGYGHFALAAPDIEPVFAAALAAGATAIKPPGPSPEPGVRFAFLADPEGNLIELVERG